MSSVFSHIVHTRLSASTEDVATDALCYILQSSDAAREGFLDLLRSAAPELPPLWYQTQQAEDGIRPDLWGFDGHVPRVLVESKFWAGLTDNQPVAYLQALAATSASTALLMLVPTQRRGTIWREVNRRLRAAGVEATEGARRPGIYR